MTTLREKLVKIGAKVVRHGRSVTFQLAEVAIPRRLFAARPAAEASTDMTPYFINVVGLNQRAPGPPHLPNGRFLAPDCTLPGRRPGQGLRRRDRGSLICR